MKKPMIKQEDRMCGMSKYTKREIEQARFNRALDRFLLDVVKFLKIDKIIEFFERKLN